MRQDPNAIKALDTFVPGGWDTINAMQQGGRPVAKPLPPINEPELKARIEREAAKFHNAQDAATVDRLGAVLPSGYVRDGSTYVFRGAIDQVRPT